MESDSKPRTNSFVDVQLTSETSFGRNCEKKADAAPGSQTKILMDEESKSPSSLKRKLPESSCNPGKQ